MLWTFGVLLAAATTSRALEPCSLCAKGGCNAACTAMRRTPTTGSCLFPNSRNPKRCCSCDDDKETPVQVNSKQPPESSAVRTAPQTAPAGIQIYSLFENGPVSTLDITLIVKCMSKFRWEQMDILHKSIRWHYPAIRVIVGDDTFSADYAPPWSRHPNTTLVALPHDAGLSLGRNMLVQMVETEFVVILEDDFVFSRFTNLERMARAFRRNPKIDIVGGGLSRGGIDSAQYISYGLQLDIRKDGTASFTPIQGARLTDGCYRTEVVFNFFMARTQVLLAFPWNPLLKVGEHEPFFLALKLQGRTVYECPEVTIYHNVTRTLAYRRNSHRYQLHRYSRHICEQFKMLNVLSSVWSSIVCSPTPLFCSLDQPRDQHYETICKSLDPPYAHFGTFQPPFHGAKVLPAVPLGASKPSTRIFVVVLTHCANANARDAYRRYVFANRNDTLVDYRFFIGQPRGSCELSADDITSQDVVVMNDADDGYENLVDKVVTAMRWVSKNVNSEVVLKVDDDVFIRLDFILHWYLKVRVQYLDTSGRVSRLYLGKVVPFGQPVIRSKHKWWLPTSQYSANLLPRYCNGPAYLVSLDAAAELGRYTKWVRRNPFRLEDVFTSLVLAEINIFAHNLQPNGRSISTMFLMTNPWQLLDDRTVLCALHSIGQPGATFPLLYDLVNGDGDISLAQEIFRIEINHTLASKRLDESAAMALLKPGQGGRGV